MNSDWQQRLTSAIEARRGRLAGFGVKVQARVATSEGLKVEARARHGAKMVDPGPGIHLWTVLGVWRVVDPEAERFELDLENLLTLQGPGCFKCEQGYTAALAASASCPGVM